MVDGHDVMTDSNKICLKDAADIFEKEKHASPKASFTSVLVKEEEVCSASSCQDSAPKISLSELDRIMRGRDPSNPLLSEEGSPILFDTALLELPHPASGHQSSFSSLVDNATTSGSLYCCPQGMYTLKDCLTRSGKITTIMGLIIEVSAVNEIKRRKTGPMKRQPIPSSRVVLADPTHSPFTVTMWWSCAVWAERLSSGDIIILSDISIKEYGPDMVGNTTQSSTIINLHQPRNVPVKLRGRVTDESLASFVSWARSDHHCIYNEYKMPKSQRNVLFVTSSSIKPSDSIIHFRGVVSSFISDNVVSIADNPLSKLLLILVGEKFKHWKKSLQEGIGLVWEMRHLQVLPESTQTGSVCLQATSRSNFHCLKQDCPLSKDILKQWSKSDCNVLKICNSVSDIRPTSSASGQRYQLSNVKVSSISIIGCNISLDLDNMDYDVLTASVIPGMVYNGCGQCTSEIISKDNYQPLAICSRCESKERGYFYRSWMMNLIDQSDSSNCLTVLAHHSSIDMIFSRCSLASNQLSHNTLDQATIEGVSRQLHAIFSGCGSWIVGVNVIKDENNFVKSFDCELQEWMQY